MAFAFVREGSACTLATRLRSSPLANLLLLLLAKISDGNASELLLVGDLLHLEDLVPLSASLVYLEILKQD